MKLVKIILFLIITILNKPIFCYEDKVLQLFNSIWNDPERKWKAEHMLRVAQISVSIGKEMGLSQKELDKLFEACLVHDCCVKDLPIKIVNKPGVYTPEERKIMGEHIQDGLTTLKNHGITKDPSTQHIYEVVNLHHESVDGSGPYRLKTEQIPLFAKITKAADVYDAIRSKRPYKDGKSHKETLNEIEEKNMVKDMDPEIYEILVKKMKNDDLKLYQMQASPPNDKKDSLLVTPKTSDEIEKLLNKPEVFPETPEEDIMNKPMIFVPASEEIRNQKGEILNPPEIDTSIPPFRSPQLPNNYNILMAKYNPDQWTEPIKSIINPTAVIVVGAIGLTALAATISPPATPIVAIMAGTLILTTIQNPAYAAFEVGHAMKNIPTQAAQLKNLPQQMSLISESIKNLALKSYKLIFEKDVQLNTGHMDNTGELKSLEEQTEEYLGKE